MKTFLELFGIIIAIVIAIFMIYYPFWFDRTCKEERGKTCLSYWGAGFQTVSILVVFAASGDTETELFSAIAITVLIYFIAAGCAYRKCKKMGLEPLICWMGVLAQLLSPVFIFAVLILIGALISSLYDIFNKITGQEEKK